MIPDDGEITRSLGLDHGWLVEMLGAGGMQMESTTWKDVLWNRPFSTETEQRLGVV